MHAAGRGRDNEASNEAKRVGMRVSEKEREREEDGEEGRRPYTAFLSVDPRDPPGSGNPRDPVICIR